MTITHGFKPVFRDPVTMSGKSSEDFLDIPSWVRRITIVVAEISVTSTGFISFQLGGSGGIETTGYVTNDGVLLSTSITVANRTTEFLAAINSASYSVSGEINFTLLNPATNMWVGKGYFMGVTAATTHYPIVGHKALSSTLDRVRFSTSSGTFDAGMARIILE